MYKKGEPITVLTAHDFPSGHVADVAGMEIVLVGDSLAMVALGMEDTSEVLLERDALALPFGVSCSKDSIYCRLNHSHELRSKD